MRRSRWLDYLTDFLRMNRRMHNKSMTVDCLASIAGGRNIGDAYFGLGDDTPCGVTRGAVQTLAKKLDVNEAQVIHIALSKLATDLFRSYERDDGPSTQKQVTAIRKNADKHLPKGKTISKEVLIE